jgi:hypothetical protein
MKLLVLLFTIHILAAPSLPKSPSNPSITTSDPDMEWMEMHWSVALDLSDPITESSEENVARAEVAQGEISQMVTGNKRKRVGDGDGNYQDRRDGQSDQKMEVEASKISRMKYLLIISYWLLKFLDLNLGCFWCRTTFWDRFGNRTKTFVKVTVGNMQYIALEIMIIKVRLGIWMGDLNFHVSEVQDCILW